MSQRGMLTSFRGLSGGFQVGIHLLQRVERLGVLTDLNSHDLRLYVFGVVHVLKNLLLSAAVVVTEAKSDQSGDGSNDDADFLDQRAGRIEGFLPGLRGIGIQWGKWFRHIQLFANDESLLLSGIQPFNHGPASGEVVSRSDRRNRRSVFPSLMSSANDLHRVELFEKLAAMRAPGQVKA